MPCNLLFSESANSDGSITRETVAALSSLYGDLRLEVDPTSFAGYTLLRNWETNAITVTMTQKIEDAVDEHASGIRSGEKLDLPKGQRLTEMADKMKMPE